MTRWMWAVAAVAVGAVGCQRDTGPAQPLGTRAEIKELTNSTVEFIPKPGQLPYCLLYTVSEKDVIRQLTMTRENRSIKCEAGKRIYNASFRVPAEEGKIRAYIIFSDQRIQAGSVAQQLYDLRDKERVSAMDFRLPGAVAVDVLDFTPKPDTSPVKGAVVGTTDITEGAKPQSTEAQAEGAAAPETPPTPAAPAAPPATAGDKPAAQTPH